MLIRDATTADMAAVVDIYNALIPTTTITWSENLQTLDERLAWFEVQRQRANPVLVVVDRVGDAEAVVGFASYGSFRGEGRWPGYRHTVEHTVHVARSHWGTGASRLLLETLLSRAQEAGHHVMVGAIDSDNPASLRFHERLGFAEVGRMPEIGRKFDRWLELVLVQKILDDRR